MNVPRSASVEPAGRRYLSADVASSAVAFDFGQLGGQTGGTFKAELISATSDDEGRVVGVHRNRGAKRRQLDVEGCIVFECKDGRIVDGREHFDDLYAWDDFWS